MRKVRNLSKISPITFIGSEMKHKVFWNPPHCEKGNQMETKAAQQPVRRREKATLALRMTEQKHRHRADLTGLTKVPGQNIALLWHLA